MKLGFLAAALIGLGLSQAPLVPTELAAPSGGSFYGLTPQFAVSPDGREVAFVVIDASNQTGLWLRPLASSTAHALAGTEQASYPFWSADGRFIGFFANNKLMKIAASGGTPAVICDAPTGRGGTWNADGVIVFTSGISDPLRRVSASGGQPQPASVLDTTRENSHRWPQFLPDGRHILFWAGAGAAPAELKIGSLDSRDVVSVVPADSNAVFLNGHILYARGAALMAMPFDSGTLQRKGEPVKVVEPLSGDAGSSFASLSASASGTLLYTKGDARGFVLTWFDRTGRKQGTIGEAGQYTNVALSADGISVAVSLTAGSPANRDIWRLPATGREPQRVTTDRAVDATPVWSADGRALVFSSQRSGPYQIYRAVLDRPGSDELLFTSDAPAIATDWSHDGQFVAYTRGTAATGFDVWTVSVPEPHQPRPFAQGPGAEDNAVFSPDGRWVAYQSNETGRNEIFVRGFSDGAARGAAVKVSRDGGTQPLFQGDGRDLFFFAPDGSVMCAHLRLTASTFEANTPFRLFAMPVSLVLRRSLAVAGDGQRFLIPTFDDRVMQTITALPRWSTTPAR